MYIECNSKEKMTNSVLVAEVFRDILKAEHETDQQKEHFWSMGLTTKNRIIYLELVSLGTLTEGLVHPREVFKSAIIKGVACLIFCHNHPSGEAEPSRADIDITKRLKEGGDLLGLKVLDHIILADNGLYSFQGEGKL